MAKRPDREIFDWRPPTWENPRPFTDDQIDRILDSVPITDVTDEQRAELVDRLEIAKKNLVLNGSRDASRPDNAQLKEVFDKIERAARALRLSMGIDDETPYPSLSYVHFLPDAVLKGFLWANVELLQSDRKAGCRTDVADMVIGFVSTLPWIELWAATARDSHAGRVRDATNRSRYRGQPFVNAFTMDIMKIWEDVLKRNVGTSVGSPQSDNEGKGGGPLVRFTLAIAQETGNCLKPDTPENIAEALDGLSSTGVRQRIERLRRRHKTQPN